MRRAVGGPRGKLILGAGVIVLAAASAFLSSRALLQSDLYDVPRYLHANVVLRRAILGGIAGPNTDCGNLWSSRGDQC